MSSSIQTTRQGIAERLEVLCTYWIFSKELLTDLLDLQKLNCLITTRNELYFSLGWLTIPHPFDIPQYPKIARHGTFRMVDIDQFDYA